MYKGALLYATKNHFPNCMKMTGKMGGNKFAKPDSVSTPEYKLEAKVVVGGTKTAKKKDELRLNKHCVLTKKARTLRMQSFKS